MSKELGDEGERVVAALLRERGYGVREIGGNYPVIDLEVDAIKPFRVSVKTSASRRHVRMGASASIAKLRDNDFVFALMPTLGASSINLAAGAYDLLILSGRLARTDALHVHESYLAEKAGRSGTAGVMVKSYSRRPIQAEVWRRWSLHQDDWSALPAPLETS